MTWYKICPWCGEKFSILSGGLGTRSSINTEQWYDFFYRTATCPYCSKRVKPTSKGREWLLLTVPFLVEVPFELIFFPNRIGFSPFFGLFGFLLVVGLVLYRQSIEFEKVEDQPADLKIN